MKTRKSSSIWLSFLLCALSWGLVACRKCTLKECFCVDQPSFRISLDTLGHRWTNQQASETEIVWIDQRTNQIHRTIPAFYAPHPTRHRTFPLIPFFYYSSLSPRMEHSRFIIRQPTLGLADTLDNIRYGLQMERRICNQCSLPPDDFYDCGRPIRVTLRHNGQTLASSDDSSITIFRQ